MSWLVNRSLSHKNTAPAHKRHLLFTDLIKLSHQLCPPFLLQLLLLPHVSLARLTKVCEPFRARVSAFEFSDLYNVNQDCTEIYLTDLPDWDEPTLLRYEQHCRVIIERLCTTRRINDACIFRNTCSLAKGVA